MECAHHIKNLSNRREYTSAQAHPHLILKFFNDVDSGICIGKVTLLAVQYYGLRVYLDLNSAPLPLLVRTDVYRQRSLSDDNTLEIS